MPRVSIYAPLTSYLTAQSAAAITLTFATIERIIGASLSRTAQTDYRTWTSAERRHVVDLERAGWEAYLHVGAQTVEFRRVVVAAVR